MTSPTLAKDGRDDLAAEAVDVAAKATGLRPDQIERAVAEYRAASYALHVEPDWTSQSHMSGSGFGCAQYIDPAGETKVCLQIDSWKEHGDWKQESIYTFQGKAYPTYGEARAIELKAAAKQTPYAVRLRPSPTKPEDGK